MPLAKVQETLLRVPEEYLVVVNDYLLSLIKRTQEVDNIYGSLSEYANPELREKEEEAFSLAMKEKYGECLFD